MFNAGSIDFGSEFKLCVTTPPPAAPVSPPSVFPPHPANKEIPIAATNVSANNLFFISFPPKLSLKFES